MTCSQGPDLNSLGGALQLNRDLQSENANLREAIRQSNQALKERCEELQQFQLKNREEKVFLARKFQEARALVEQLRAANSDLQRRAEGEYEEGKIEGNEFLLLLRARKEELEEVLKTLRAENQELRRKLAVAGSLVVIQERNEEQGPETQQQAAVASPVSSSPANTAVEIKLEDGMSKLKIAESEKSDLQHKLTLVQTRIAQFEQSQERLRRQEAELQEQKVASEQKLQGLSKQLEQMTEDQASLKAQVTSLLAELQDSQNSLEVKTQQCSEIEQKCRRTEEKLRVLEQEMELQKKQSSVTVDQLRIAVHSYESALKTERQNASEDKRKLAQLQAAYHQLFMDYDVMANNVDGKNNKIQVDEVMQQLREAEDALVMKQELIDKLKEDAERMKTELETIPVLNAQAEVFKADFLAERSAREKLHEQKELQQERLLVLQAEYNKLRADQEDAARAHIEEMQRRHNDSLRAPMSSPGNYVQSGNTIPFNAPAEPSSRRSIPDEQPDFRCPKCQYLAPDMDTLQIHVMDCIQ
ncbi:NF-kappa-B essential modulator-like isoform X2 [Heterodontus francisci]|uniref:NF-kappa-B essential modulator-like isoform X2 n=1 Tax=Heterodontus francisci TaxID=7792 RepID=UPI00355BE288